MCGTDPKIFESKTCVQAHETAAPILTIELIIRSIPDVAPEDIFWCETFVSPYAH